MGDLGVSFRLSLELAHMLSRIVEVLDKHKDIPEIQSALDALEEGNGPHAAEMLDRALQSLRALEDAHLVSAIDIRCPECNSPVIQVIDGRAQCLRTACGHGWDLPQGPCPHARPDWRICPHCNGVNG